MMQVEFKSTMIEADGTVYTMTLWNKVSGKERIYINSASGKEYGYINLSDLSLSVTRTFGSRRGQEMFREAAAQYIGTIVVTKDAPKVETATSPAKFDVEGNIKHFDDASERRAFHEARKDWAYPGMTDKQIYNRMIHDL